MSESVIPMFTSIAGGFFSGILLGYFIKKIIKIMIFVAGGIVGLLLYLQQEQIISVNIERFQNSSIFIFNSIGSSFEKMIQVGDTNSLGIPLIGGLTAGFAVGLMKG